MSTITAEKNTHTSSVPEPTSVTVESSSLFADHDLSAERREFDCAERVRPRKWGSRIACSAVLKKLSQLKNGKLCLRKGCDEVVLGNPGSEAMPAVVDIRSDAFFTRLILGGALGAAESYMDGEWTSPDLIEVFRVLLANSETLSKLRPGRLSPVELLRRISHFRNRNSAKGSRHNIHEHYDLGNDFFSLFLDDSMMYSSAVFSSQHSSLEEASWEKVDRVCRRLQLSPGDRVIEIGTGWGGFALHAASEYDCHVTTTTISDEQYEFARHRIQAAGLSDKVTLLKKDYRDLTGTYDKLVSLEMVEAVGQSYLPGFFGTCSRLLNERGAMLLQAIVMPEQGHDEYSRSVDFIQKYIFPGGYLPSVSQMQNCIQACSDLRLLELQDFGHHYAKTLRHWNERFHSRLDDVRTLGFSERFIRMWRYYLCYCEAAFLERATGLVQAVWAKPGCRLGTIR